MAGLCGDGLDVRGGERHGVGGPAFVEQLRDAADFGLADVEEDGDLVGGGVGEEVLDALDERLGAAHAGVSCSMGRDAGAQPGW
jgi:hypothetical protein